MNRQNKNLFNFLYRVSFNIWTQSEPPNNPFSRSKKFSPWPGIFSPFKPQNYFLQPESPISVKSKTGKKVIESSEKISKGDFEIALTRWKSDINIGKKLFLPFSKKLSTHGKKNRKRNLWQKFHENRSLYATSPRPQVSDNQRRKWNFRFIAQFLLGYGISISIREKFFLKIYMRYAKNHHFLLLTLWKRPGIP